MLFESAGAPPEALEPLMRGTIENGFELTGPISRGDWATVEAHRAAIRAARPELDHLYETLAGATVAARMKDVRTIDELEPRSRRQRRARADDGRAPRRPPRRSSAAARRRTTASSLSLFVNPAQFDEQADLAAYPRDEARDLALAEAEGVDVVFAPSADEMYPPGFADVDRRRKRLGGLEGDARPGHFRGVATVCLKLFNIVRPERAYFGQKDAQQVAVIRRLVRDLNLPVEIRVLPTVRDPDGLALSSRNARLSAEERARALALPRALAAGAEAIAAAIRSPPRAPR